MLGQEYAYFRGLGTHGGSSVLPPQSIPKNRKNNKWKKACLDGLEAEGLRQYMGNLKYKAYYDMISGKLDFTEVVEEDKSSLYKYITEFQKEKLNIPSHIRHHDLIYPLVSKIVGEWTMAGDKLRFDTTDDVSTNDYIRERTVKLEQYAKTLFQRELKKIMLLSGMDVDEDFASEEEAQQYEAMQQQVIQEYFPDKIDQNLRKNFKTEAAQWAEKTWERDYERYRMHILKSMEARDIILTGRSTRHYRIGYDYYYPEYWHPIEVFHSKESSITRVEDSEFAGRIKWYTITELINLYGDILSEKERRMIYKSYFGPNYEDQYSTNSHYEKNTSIFGEGYFDQVTVPFKGYSDHKLSLEFEAATGIPLSERTDTRTGVTTPSFSMPLDNNIVGYGVQLSQALRNDIDIRLDTIQTTEAYWKGTKKVGLITRRTDSGYLHTEEIDEDILKEFITKYEIKTLRSISLSEYNILPDVEKENTLVWIDAPIVYRGVKIRVSGIGIEDDIYKVEELPYQIKGEKGNIFDLKLPVCGHIGNSFCDIIRPYQITYNYLMNQVNDYLQKEIGAFFVIDVNAIPTDYFDLPEGDDALFEIRNIAKTTGFLPTDLSRNNLNQQGGLTFNPMVYNNASFTEPIMRNIQLAEKYKWMAYETLGLTPQAMGTPGQYSTAEGIQIGQKAYFAQTQGIEQVLTENERANAEVHINVAQYCQLNNKDANYLYMASDNEVEFLSSIKDEDFALRQIDVRSTYDPKKRSMFETMKRSLLENNTMGSDALAMVELFMSDDFMELKEAAVRARKYLEKSQQQKIESDQQIAQMQLQKEMKIHEDKMNIEKAKIEGRIRESELDALGRTGGRDEQTDSYKIIQDAADRSLKEQDLENKNNQELMKIKKDLQIASQNFLSKTKQFELEKEKINIERDKIAAMKYISDNTTKNSIINKN